ncbi:hypothetical protein NLU13_5561 [Sarocladium strictum]|uniref:SPX domain-containing protein n=1 Tax=Sarocladium strictum TaxID=5046 RepID=A0AA39GH46_SARSR|nr:hypothetical protein NLU13_5561 [Sarocladium strictum]
MKFGTQLVNESVPEWSLHNLDYNSLKHEIKVHTSRNQATAIAIPGHQDSALHRFEDTLYHELCHQHERVDLFISSKANEVDRRLKHLSRSIERWLGKQPAEPSPSQNLRFNRRFAKYERDLLQCGDDIHALTRFANAQVVAFRKILKKYKKWTGSTTLGSRFVENVLRDPKSFTRRDFSYLQTLHDDILKTLNDAAPTYSEPSSPSSDEQPGSSSSPRLSTSGANGHFQPLPPPFHEAQPPQVKYWNEYDDGSETGDNDNDYAIYINPDDGPAFPGLGYIQAVVGMPFEKAKQWFHTSNKKNPERRPLLAPNGGIAQGYNSAQANTDSEEEGYASSEEIPTQGYVGLYAFPSISEQKVVRYREHVLFLGTIGCFVASFILLIIAGILISTGRHKLRVEVDAGVTVGVVVSLFCACSALGMTLYRKDVLPLVHRLAVWSAFIASCVLNGMLLILVVGNSP